MPRGRDDPLHPLRPFPGRPRAASLRTFLIANINVPKNVTLTEMNLVRAIGLVKDDITWILVQEGSVSPRSIMG